MGKYLQYFYLYITSLEVWISHTQTHIHTDSTTRAVYTGVIRWAISTGWEEAPLSAAPMVSTQTSSWTEPAHTLPAHTTQNSITL